MASKKTKAVIIAMTAALSVGAESTNAKAAAAALSDIKHEFGADETASITTPCAFDLVYDYDPSDGDCA